MQIDELKKKMQSELEEGKPKQAVFDIYLNQIESLLNQGYTIPLLCKKLELNIKPNYFKNLIITARNKIKNKASENLPENNQTQSPQPQLQQEKIEYNLSDWKGIFHDISEHLIKDIQKLGLSITDVKSLIQQHSILNTTQLRKRINELKDVQRASKFQ